MYNLVRKIRFICVMLIVTVQLAGTHLLAEEQNYNYNHPTTADEPVTLAGPLPGKNWKPPANSVLNVRQLGAKGDGVTDDTEVLKKIFKNVDHGQVIFFPAGKYLISDTLKLDYRFGVQIRMHGGFRSDALRTSNCRGIFWSAEGPQDRPGRPRCRGANGR